MLDDGTQLHAAGAGANKGHQLQALSFAVIAAAVASKVRMTRVPFPPDELTAASRRRMPRAIELAMRRHVAFQHLYMMADAPDAATQPADAAEAEAVLRRPAGPGCHGHGGDDGDAFT